MNMKTWLKENKKAATVFMLIFLVSTAAFALGYITGIGREHAPIVIEKCSTAKAF